MENINEETLAAVRVQEVANGRAAIVPDGYTLHHLDCLGNTPPRKAGSVELLDLETLIDHVKAEDAENEVKSVVYVSNNKVNAFFNYYSKDGLGWGDHAAVMHLCKTVEWDNWNRFSGEPISPVSYTHLRAHETRHDLVCRLLLEKKKTTDP